MTDNKTTAVKREDTQDLSVSRPLDANKIAKAEVSLAMNTPTATPAPAKRASSSMVDWVNQNIKNPEDVDAKKERNRKIISAIGDGISALSNIYFTTKGGNNVYDAKNSMSKATQLRYDKLKADYEKDKDRYNNAMFQARQFDQGQANWREQFKNTLEQQRYARDRQETQDAMNKELHNLQLKYQQGQLSIQELQKQVAEVEAQYAERKAKAQIQATGARGGVGGRADYYASIGGVPYRSEADYNAAVKTIARRLGIPVEVDSGIDPVTKLKSTKAREISDIAADINNYQPPEEKPKEETPKESRTTTYAPMYNGYGGVGGMLWGGSSSGEKKDAAYFDKYKTK